MCSGNSVLLHMKFCVISMFLYILHTRRHFFLKVCLCLAVFDLCCHGKESGDNKKEIAQTDESAKAWPIRPWQMENLSKVLCSALFEWKRGRKGSSGHPRAGQKIAPLAGKWIGCAVGRKHNYFDPREGSAREGFHGENLRVPRDAPLSWPRSTTPASHF